MDKLEAFQLQMRGKCRARSSKPGTSSVSKLLSVASYSSAIRRSDGRSTSELSPIRPSWVLPNAQQPPAYHYRWQETEKALSYAGEMPGDPFDGVVLNFVNPLTGSATVPTCMCGVQMLRRGEITKSHRHTVRGGIGF